MCGNTSHPLAAPAKNSGTAEKKKPKVYFFSFRVRPGTRKAKIWYSQIGLAATIAIVTAIWRRRSNAPVTVV